MAHDGKAPSTEAARRAARLLFAQVDATLCADPAIKMDPGWYERAAAIRAALLALHLDLTGRSGGTEGKFLGVRS